MRKKRKKEREKEKVCNGTFGIFVFLLLLLLLSERRSRGDFLYKKEEIIFLRQTAATEAEVGSGNCGSGVKVKTIKISEVKQIG